MRRRPNSKYGFTLVELIVVIVIVVIGGVLVTNCAQRNRGHYRGRGCSSNLRQIGLAMEQYDMDFNQGYPRASAPGKIGIGASSLALLARPYPKAEKLSGQLTNLRGYICWSSSDKPDQFTQFTKSWTDFSSAKNISYGYDPGHSPGDGTDVIVSADYSADGKNSNNHGANAGQNVLFLGDWHVEWVRTPNCGVEDNNIYLNDGPDLPRAKDSIIVR